MTLGKWAATGASLFLCARTVQAQPIPVEVQREARRIQERAIERQNELERRQLQSQSPIKDYTPVAVEEAVSLNDSVCQPVTAVTLSGMTLLGAQRFAKLASNATGICISAATLKALERAITNAYVQRGYITSRAFAVRNPSRPDLVTVRVVEGRVQAVRSEGIAGSRRYGTDEIHFAFGTPEERPLNLRDLEQGVDQLARLPSASPSIDIVPAAATGASDIIIKRERVARALRPSFAVNNGGSKSTGEATIIASLDGDDLFGIADYFSAYFTQDISSGVGKNSTGSGLFVSAPAGRLTISASANQQSYRSILTSNDLMFSNDGRTISGFVAVDGLVFRNARHKLALAVQMALFDTVTRIQSIRLSTNSYRLATLGAKVRLQSRIDTAVFSADFGFVQGLSILGAESADFGPGGPTLTAGKVEAGFALQKPIKLGRSTLRYSTSVRGQFSRSPLLGAERISIGGEQSVRGYRDDGLSGDHGVVARTQIAFPLFTAFKQRKSNSTTRFSGVVGHDAGWVWNIGSDAGVTLLQSVVGGVEVANSRLAGRILVAKALSPLPGFDRSRPEILASLSLTI